MAFLTFSARNSKTRVHAGLALGVVMSEITPILSAIDFGVADQKLVAARELKQEGAERTMATECPAGDVKLVLAHPIASAW
jgi:hypothetical protein